MFKVTFFSEFALRTISLFPSASFPFIPLLAASACWIDAKQNHTVHLAVYFAFGSPIKYYAGCQILHSQMNEWISFSVSNVSLSGLAMTWTKKLRNRPARWSSKIPSPYLLVGISSKAVAPWLALVRSTFVVQKVKFFKITKFLQEFQQCKPAKPWHVHSTLY